MLNSKFSISLRPILLGILVGVICTGVFLVLISFLIFSSGKFSENLLPILSLALVSISSFLSGYITGKITGQKGIVYGLLCGLGIFFMTFLGGIIISNSAITSFLLWKALAIFLSGCLGGIIGVNKN